MKLSKLQINTADLQSLILYGKTKKLNPDFKFLDEKDSKYKFSDHYNKEILPSVKEFEQKRIVALGSFRYWFIIATVVNAIILILSYKLYKPGDDILNGAFSIFTLFTIIYGLSSLPLVNYNNTIKDIIFPKIFSFFGTNFSYSRIANVDYTMLNSTGIMPNYNQKSSEDKIKGVYKDVNIELYELLLRYKAGKNTSTVFRGMIIHLTMNKNFKGHTIVKNDRGSLVNFFSSSSSGLQKVTLEDSKFEGEFDIFSSNQVESRYLLTPAFMERFLKLKGVLRSPQIEAAFLNNNLILKISLMENRFEPGSVFEPATFEEDIKTILSEMNLIFEIIDVLKLNEKTGL